MDPITGVQLIASVVQFIDCGIRAAKTCQELYEHGSPSEFDCAADAAHHMGNVTCSLATTRHSVDTTPSGLSTEEKNLLNLALKCEGYSTALLDELGKLQPHDQQSRREAIKKTFRAMWKHDKIKKLQDDLNSCRALLDSSLLRQLR